MDRRRILLLLALAAAGIGKIGLTLVLFARVREFSTSVCTRPDKRNFEE